MIDGLDGLSAFEIAVSHGFVGSERDWLKSLKGEPGVPGEPGAGVDLEAVRDLVKEAVSAIPLPRDGRDGLQGPPGMCVPAEQRKLAASPSLGSWDFVFERDPFGCTVRLLVGPLNSSPIFEIVPIRDDRGLMTSAVGRPLS